MFKKVETQVDFVQLEHRVLSLWDEIDAFGQLRRQVEGGELWSFIDGPITANNPMGVHHAWGRTYKDAFHRFFAMNGRDIRYQPGFDCQGLWVELEVEKELGFRTKREIEEYGLDRFTETCKNRVRKYAGIQSKQSQRLGWWMDWDDAYYTMSDANNYMIWRFLKECHARGFLRKGTDVMPWSGRAGTAYSDMEVKEGRKLTTHTAAFVRLPIRGRENEYLVVWTTTPWTLAANVGVAVSSDLEYAKLRNKRDGAAYWVAKDNLEFVRRQSEFKDGFPPFGSWPKGTPKLKTLDQIFKELGGYEIEEVVPGSKLVGLGYDGPFDDLPAQQRTGGFASSADVLDRSQASWPSAAESHRVIDPGKDSRGNPYVVAGEGTGLVHTAPGCGDVDHVWGQQHELVSIAPLDPSGRYVEGFGPFTGMDPTDPSTTETIIAALKERGFLLAQEKYPHIYPHCWRTGDELVYRLVEEWYISMDWRDEIKDVATRVDWLPDEMHGKERELDWLTTMRDWMISKKRYWGLALPIWECSSCGHFEVIGSREELAERAVEGFEEFEASGHSPHRPYVDAITIECSNCGARTKRIPDVGNPWLDAGIVAYSTTRFGEDPEYWSKWVPAHLITECFPGQFRNWFYALLAMSTMMEKARTSDGPAADRRPPFQSLLGHALVMNEHGEEMHKSDGTAIWFEEAAEQIGVDTMRWMYCAQTPTSNLKFGLRHPDKPVDVEIDGTKVTQTIDGAQLCKVTSTPADEVRRRVVLPLWNSYAFFSNYARLENFVPGAVDVPKSDRSQLDRWLLSDLNKLVTTVRTAFESYRLHDACNALEQFIDGLSRWYIRRSRRRFWRGQDSDEASKRDSLSAYQTLYETLETLVRLAAPIVPFVTESIYQDLVRSHDESAPQSVHLSPFPTADDGWVDEELSRDMATAMRVVSLARSIRSQHRVGLRQPLREVVVLPSNDVDERAIDTLRDHIVEELNVKKLDIQRNPDFVSWVLKPRFDVLGPKLGAKVKHLRGALGALDPVAAEAALRADGRVEVDIDGETLALTTEELQVQPTVEGDRPMAYEHGSIVLLDLELDDELIVEGLARDVIRNLQDLRRTEGLEMEQRISLTVHTSDDELRRAFEHHGELIGRELLAEQLDVTDTAGEGMRDLTIRSGKELSVSIRPR